MHGTPWDNATQELPRPAVAARAPIAYTDDATALRPDQLTGFFAGWPVPPPPETLLALLRASYRRVVAVDTATGNAIGFATAISDGILSAFVPLLEVLPAYQDRGIGSAILDRLLDQLRHVYAVDLCCEPHLRGYYERFGMRPILGMGLRNPDALGRPPATTPDR